MRRVEEDAAVLPDAAAAGGRDGGHEIADPPEFTAAGDPLGVLQSAPGTGAGSRIGRNMTALAGGQAITWTATLLWTLVVPRVLGPSGLGLITAVWSATAVLGIFLGLGTEGYLSRELVARPDEAPRLVGAALVLRIVMIPVFVASALVYGHLAHYRGQASMVLWLAIGATFLTLLADPLQSAFQAKERMEYMALGDVINKSAQGLVGIALVLLGAGAVGLTGSWLVVSGVVVVLSAFWIRPLVRIQMRVHVRDVVRLVRDSLAYFAAGLFYLVYLWIDSVMLSLMTTSTVVGWYAVPTKLFTTMMFVPVIVSTAWLPRLVTAWEQERDDFVEVARKPVELVAILGLPICAGLALVSRWVIPLLYGDAFKESVSVLVILGFTLVPMYCNIMLAQVIVAMKRQVRWTFVMAGATVVNPTFNYFLIRWAEHRYHDGAIGAAISLLLTELLIVVVAMVLVGRVVLNWRSASRVGRAALAAGAMWGVGTLARPLGGFPAAILGSLTFVLLGWLFRIISAEEMEMGKATVRKLLRRSQPSA